ncbi:MAG: DNA methyltransferase, partial [Phycisphaerae bacterium]
MPTGTPTPPNTLYYGDNLKVLREHIDDASVDLVYLDPPFNSNADYNVLFAEKDGTAAPAQIKAFGDTWTWDLKAAQEYAELLNVAHLSESHQRTAATLRGLQQVLGGSDMLAYLSMMALRLLELRRVMKETASIYLHCDPTASHYLKVVMDAVFGPQQFRSEIVWKRTSAHGNASANYAAVHDLILCYSKSETRTWNRVYQPYDEDYVREHFVHKDPDGRVFRRADLRNPGYRPNL